MTGRGGSEGFTLLELLVVMFIIGIIAAMATLSIGVASSEKGAEKELQRIEDLLALASEESVLQGREFGLTFYAKEYVFSTYDPEQARWVPLESDAEPFGPRRFPPETLVELEIEDRVVRIPDERPEPSAKKSAAEKGEIGTALTAAGLLGGRERDRPQVFILSSGDITPFELRLRPAIGQPGISMTVAENGTVKQVRDES
jgi:general secretion pathway protein H